MLTSECGKRDKKGETRRLSSADDGHGRLIGALGRDSYAATASPEREHGPG
jgi:hypothetical protein